MAPSTPKGPKSPSTLPHGLTTTSDSPKHTSLLATLWPCSVSGFGELASRVRKVRKYKFSRNWEALCFLLFEGDAF